MQILILTQCFLRKGWDTYIINEFIKVVDCKDRYLFQLKKTIRTHQLCCQFHNRSRGLVPLNAFIIACNVLRPIKITT